MEFIFRNLNYTALMCAAWKGYEEIAKLLLEQKNNDINTKNVLKSNKYS